jgi:endonuclease/exonuclease/phosphatase family metal-dependent hydrolase
MRLNVVTAALVGAAVLGGCARGVNYLRPDGPRYAGGVLHPIRAGSGGGAARAIRLVTFNVQWAAQVDSTIALLGQTPELEGADVVALQEVDAAACERIARALDMRYVYYPATRHPKFHRDFGNAVLTRWPIVADRKVLLPHLGRFRRTVRAATAATVLVDGAAIRVYSAHLGMVTEVSPGGKRDQVRAILADAAAHSRVIVMGDMNSHGIGETFRSAGYTWPTERNPRTLQWGNWDHVFVKGIVPADRATGVVTDNRRASDHRAVWARVAAPPAP